MANDLTAVVVSGTGESEITEKRSRFLGHIAAAATEEEAREFIARMRKTYHDARHNCWCYRIQEGLERFSDDGEPQGSAGMPMLEMLRMEKVQQVVCVVTRYFGGVLLGTGGLSRAYTAAAKAALSDAGTRRIAAYSLLRLRCPYGMVDRIRARILASGALIEDLRYDAEVEMTVLADGAIADALLPAIRDLSGGRITPVREDGIWRSL